MRKDTVSRDTELSCPVEDSRFIPFDGGDIGTQWAAAVLFGFGISLTVAAIVAISLCVWVSSMIVDWP